MKKSILITGVLLIQLYSQLSIAEDLCLEEAILYAKTFSQQKGVQYPQILNVFIHNKDEVVINYGVEVDEFGNLNLGLDQKNCDLIYINKVTNDGEE